MPRHPINATFILSLADTPNDADFKYAGIVKPVAAAMDDFFKKERLVIVIIIMLLWL
jgi:hypothetical protein